MDQQLASCLRNTEFMDFNSYFEFILNMMDLVGYTKECHPRGRIVIEGMPSKFDKQSKEIEEYLRNTNETVCLEYLRERHRGQSPL